VHHIGAVTRLTAKALAKEVGHIRLIIDHQDAELIQSSKVLWFG
jgi:hypothetical protein